MAASVIIDGVIYGSPRYTAPDYNVNVGGLNIVTLDGIQFLMSTSDIERLNFPKEAVTEIDEVPHGFLHDHSMEIAFDGFASPAVGYPLKKEDVRALGVALSKIRGNCRLVAMVRILAVWSNGVCTQRRSLEDFYSNLTEAEKQRFNSL